MATSNTVVSGTFSSNTQLPANGFEFTGEVRLILRSTGNNSTWGGGVVKVLIKAADGTYQPTGISYTAGVCEVLNFGRIYGVIKLDMSGASSPSLGFELVN